MAEALWKTLDAEATEHSALWAAVASVCNGLRVEVGQPGSSLHKRIGVLYTCVGERLTMALHTRVKRALAMVCSHYLGIDVLVVSEGYVIGDDEDEAREEVQKLANAAEVPRDALANFFDTKIMLPLNPPKPEKTGP